MKKEPLNQSRFGVEIRSLFGCEKSPIKMPRGNFRRNPVDDLKFIFKLELMNDLKIAHSNAIVHNDQIYTCWWTGVLWVSHTTGMQTMQLSGILIRIVVGLMTGHAHLLIVVFARNQWLENPSQSDRSFAILTYVLSLCGIVCLVVALINSNRAKEIIGCGIATLLIGLLLGPPTYSMSANDRIDQITSGAIWFAPTWIAMWSYMGIIVGQNLPEIRGLIAKVNGQSRRLW